MAYLLLNRLHGAFQGAFLGEALGVLVSAQRQTEYLLTSDPVKLDSFQFCQEICAGQLFICSGVPPILKHKRDDERVQLSSGIAIPVGLFFHENPTRLRQQIKELTTTQIIHPDYQTQAFIVALAIATVLQAQQPPMTLMSLLNGALDAEPMFLRQQLEQVQDLLNEGASLDRALNQLGSAPTNEIEAIDTAIAIAGFCFLSTVEDFRLSVLRAVQTSHLVQLTTMLTGALAGAYNGKLGISAIEQLSTPTLSRSLYQQTDTLAGKAARQLWACWSGSYDSDPASNELPNVVSAPGILRQR